MRSPMTAILWPSQGRSTTVWALVTDMLGLRRRGLGVWLSISVHKAAMCAGVVPQQPPTTLTPSAIMPATASAYSGAWISKTVLPSSSTWGSPALACTMMGLSVTVSIRAASPRSSAGPWLQLMPKTSAPMASSVMAATSGLVPRKVRPSSSKVMVAKTGRSEFSRQARTAALISARSVIVSIIKRSTPAATPARTSSAKRS